MKMKRFVACLLVTLAPLPVALAAGGSSGREAYYRCRDAKGQTFFGDSLPQQCLDLDTEVLSDRGTVLRVIDGAASRAAKAQSKAADDAARKGKQEAQMHDRMLVEAYLSVKEIESLRDQRLALVESQIRIDEQNLSALKEREQRLVRQIQRFRPYSDKPNAGPMPDHIVEEMVSVVKSGAVTQQRIASKQAEQQDLQTKFSNDINRFKELKGIK
jgi:Domain of unknown function (DUF4124)